jgi:hypothetical protein
MTFFKKMTSKEIFDEPTVTAAVLTSDNVFTSAIFVQPYQRVNVGIMIGSQVSDILSLGNFSDTVSGAAISAIFSTASMSITLQRQYPGEMGGDFWHDVDAWSVTLAEGEDASSENISDKSEPEPMMYRIGTKPGGYETGLALVRLGTS